LVGIEDKGPMVSESLYRGKKNVKNCVGL
jgi:hypothetical protein